MATGTSLLGRAASSCLPLHFEHPHPAGAPTLQGQSAWASAGGPARPNRTGLFEDRGRSAARSLSRTAFVTSTSRFGVVSSSRSLLHASDAAQVARGGQCRSRCSRCGPFGPSARPRAAPGGRGGHPQRGVHPSVSARAFGSGHRGHARVRGALPPVWVTTLSASPVYRSPRCP